MTIAVDFGLKQEKKKKKKNLNRLSFEKISH